MLRYTYTSGSLYCCTSGHVTLSKITLSHHGVGVDIITPSTEMYHLIFQLNIQLNATQRNVAGKTIDSVRFFEWGQSRLNETTKQYGTLRQIC